MPSLSTILICLGAIFLLAIGGLVIAYRLFFVGRSTANINSSIMNMDFNGRE